MSVYIIDTETTGIHETAEVIEVAWVRPIEVDDLAGPSDQIPHPVLPGIARRFEQRYRPEKPSTFGALSVHHILPDELDECPLSSSFKLPDDCTHIVGHNIDHDWRVIGQPGVKRIDTDCMARYVWPDLDSYSQSALIYYVCGTTPETRELLKGAHGAMTDVLNNVRLLEKILEAKPEIETWSQLHEYSEACRIPRTMPIGEKQGVKGLTLDEAVEADFGFVQWVLRQPWPDEYLKRGLNEAIARVEAKLNAPPEPDTRPACQRDPACVLVAGHEGDCDHIPF